MSHHRSIFALGRPEDEKEAFPPSVDSFERCTQQCLPQRRLSTGPRQSGATHLQFDDLTMLQSRLQIPPQDLHFGQFRHSNILMESRERGKPRNGRGVRPRDCRLATWQGTA